MTTWWNKNVENRMDDFKIWVGDFDQPSKSYCRKYIADKQYKNIIDCGCGLASDYFGFQKDNYQINYTGLDSCKYFVDINRTNGINMIEAELEENLPLLNDGYDCVYSREIVEHLSYYEKAISEWIRIASKEVIIVFFIPPIKLEKEEINYWEEEDLYHNKYDIDKLEKYIINIPKVKKISWNYLNDITNRKDIFDALNKTEKDLEPIINEEAEIIKEEKIIEIPTINIEKSILHIILNN